MRTLRWKDAYANPIGIENAIYNGNKTRQLLLRLSRFMSVRINVDRGENGLAYKICQGPSGLFGGAFCVSHQIKKYERRVTQFSRSSNEQNSWTFNLELLFQKALNEQNEVEKIFGLLPNVWISSTAQ